MPPGQRRVGGERTGHARARSLERVEWSAQRCRLSRQIHAHGTDHVDVSRLGSIAVRGRAVLVLQHLGISRAAGSGPQSRSCRGAGESRRHAGRIDLPRARPHAVQPAESECVARIRVLRHRLQRAEGWVSGRLSRVEYLQHRAIRPASNISSTRRAQSIDDVHSRLGHVGQDEVRRAVCAGSVDRPSPHTAGRDAI